MFDPTKPSKPIPLLWTPDKITDEMVEAVENEIGMWHQAWDCVSPKEIIAAAANVIESC